jgi:beta-N-acetylhexosaminidase
MNATLRRQVGRLFIVGLEGPELTATERAWLRLIRPGGVILFRRNIEEAAQTATLLREVTEIIGAPIFRCVDLEGGLVDRLRDLIAPMPSAAAVFATGKPSLYKQHGRLIAQEAKLLGFNIVFAPVLDLALPESKAVMRTRTVSANPEDVIAYASSFLEGFEAEGIFGCGKHFPGLGGGNLDSHHAMPIIERSWETMWAEDILPFRALASRLPMIMISHAAYPRASKDLAPASISSFWISDVLKKQLKYTGLVISDDMEMGGILTRSSIEEASVQALIAGTDILEICKDPSLIFRAYESVLAEAESSSVFHRKIQKVIGHITNSPYLNVEPSMVPPSEIKLTGFRKQVEMFTRNTS